MKHTKELLSIKLSELMASSKHNVRHTASSVEQLAALIDSQGLLHPLIVSEQVIGKGRARKVRFAVAAGERRRRALLVLQQRGRLAASHEVLCKLVAPERALEISLAENSAREPLDPADEFEAFKALIDEGKGIEDVAARFGVSVLTVQRRLKLAALSPKLLGLYRQGGINLDQLMAQALSDDHTTQERVWFDGHEWDPTPTALRSRITTNDVAAVGNALVRFVGIDAYESAGGVVRRDLFDDDHGRYLGDAELLRRLAGEKLEALAANVRAEGWSWAEARIEVDSQALRQFVPCEHSFREPNGEEQAELAELDARGAELEQVAEAMGERDEWSVEQAECIDLEECDIAARKKALAEGRRIWSDEAKAHAGVIVAVSREGDAQVIRGLMREADRKAVQKSTAAVARRLAGVAEASAPAGETPGRASDGIKSAEVSDSLTQRLAAHRTAALQASLCANTPVALAVLAHSLARFTFEARDYREVPLMQLSPQVMDHHLLGAADDLKAGKAWAVVTAARAAWKSRLPEHPSQWLGWLVDLSMPELVELIAVCASSTVSALARSHLPGEADAVAAAVGLDMAEWWEPTADSYLKLVPKAKIIERLPRRGRGLMVTVSRP